jgi:hypothetical protein
MEPSDNNLGFIERSQYFREQNDSTKPYRKSGAWFMGRLMHDLVTCTTGLPPQTKVRIDLEKSDDKFVILKKSNDTENYKLKILNICLYVPVAQLSQPVFNEIEAILSRKEEPNAIALHHRRVEVRPISIIKNKIEFYSDSLFPESDLPCRIVLCFIETDAKNGK